MFEVVVGIDFGSSGSGFAYSFNNENDINHGYIFGANVDNKVPTEIILDDYNNVLEFGFNCKQYIKEKGLNAGHYFKAIKMNLYSKQSFIKSVNTEKPLSLTIVIQKVLEKLKEIALEELKKIRYQIQESNIKWVVTVPAIWENYQKGIMMEACTKAGLINQNADKSLFFALEPEAASLYCCRNKDINQEYLSKGKYYIICDLGGGTGDIVTHLVGANKTLKEIKSACGGNYGSNEIDKKIFNYLIFNLFGYKDFNELYQKLKNNNIKEDESVIFDGWCELERQIKDFKEGANFEKINKAEKFPINCSLFQDFFDDDTDITDLVNKFNNTKCINKDIQLSVKSKKKWIIEFPYKIIYNYIQEQVNLICKTIKEIITDSSIKINTLIFVGGYCSNEILISLIKKGLKNEIIYFLQPSKPCLAIMEGAVLFGINPNIINSRIAKYTIGMDTRDIWDENKHSKLGKKVYDDDSVERCENCFSKFIQVKQKLELNEEITRTYHMVGPRICDLKFFQTLKPNPTFTFEKGVEKMGECTLDAGRDYPKGERKFTVTMKFGGTFINVKGKHEKSGKEIKTSFVFN